MSVVSFNIYVICHFGINFFFKAQFVQVVHTSIIMSGAASKISSSPSAETLSRFAKYKKREMSESEAEKEQEKSVTGDTGVLFQKFDSVSLVTPVCPFFLSLKKFI